VRNVLANHLVCSGAARGISSQESREAILANHLRVVARTKSTKTAHSSTQPSWPVDVARVRALTAYKDFLAFVERCRSRRSRPEGNQSRVREDETAAAIRSGAALKTSSVAARAADLRNLCKTNPRSMIPFPFILRICK
jgi:hypothetical protein